MSQKRFPEELKIESVRQIVERAHPVADVSARLGVSTHSLYKWMKEQQLPPGHRQEQLSQTEELRRLRAELKRVTDRSGRDYRIGGVLVQSVCQRHEWCSGSGRWRHPSQHFLTGIVRGHRHGR